MKTNGIILLLAAPSEKICGCQDDLKVIDCTCWVGGNFTTALT